KLTPFINSHAKLTEDFKTKYWEFYKTLLKYKLKPDKQRKKEIEKEFDKLFGYQPEYFDLDKEIKRTKKNKDKLLTVLKYPQIPLHNNLSELAARLQVRKRDVCLHTMTRKGTQLQDAFMSIIHTCNLLEKNAYAYIRDRISGNNKFYLPDLVLQKVNS
ncbi:MAG: transposase, partial [Delftia sp.]|nr:transposase [Delftia sp.]